MNTADNTGKAVKWLCKTSAVNTRRRSERKDIENVPKHPYKGWAD